MKTNKFEATMDKFSKISCAAPCGNGKSKAFRGYPRCIDPYDPAYYHRFSSADPDKSASGILGKCNGSFCRQIECTLYDDNEFYDIIPGDFPWGRIVKNV